MQTLRSLPRTVLAILSILVLLTLASWGVLAYLTNTHQQTTALWQEERSDLSAQIADLQGEIEQQQSVSADLATLHEQIATAETDLDGRLAMLSDYDEQIATAEADLAALKAEQGDAEAILADLEEDLEQRPEGTGDLAMVRRRLDDAEADLDVRLQILGEREQDIAEAEARLAELEAERVEAESKLADLEGQQDQQQEAAADLAELQDQIEVAKADLEARTNLLGERDQQIAEAEARLAALDAEVDATAGQLAERQAAPDQEQAASSGELVELRRQIDVAQADLSARIATLGEHDRQIADSEARIAELNAEKANVAADIAALQAEHQLQQSAAADLAQLQTQIEGAKADLDARVEAVGAYEQQIADAKARLAEIKAEQTSAADRLTALEAELGRRQTTAAVADVAPASGPPSVDPMLNTSPFPTPDGLRLTQVHFNLGSAELTPAGLRKTREAAEWIKSNSTGKIRLVGYADTVGHPDRNKRLSERRAESLAGLLESVGISRDRIELVPRGGDSLVEPTEDQVAEPLNRCVGIFVVGDEG